MRELAEYALDVASHLGATYADVRVCHAFGEVIEMQDDEPGITEEDRRGIGIRVLVNGGWGFGATCEIESKRKIEGAVRMAIDTARASAACMPRPIALAREPVYEANWESPCLIDPFSIGAAKKLDLLSRLCKIMGAVPGIITAEGFLNFSRERKFFANSAGSRIDQSFTWSGCGITATAREGDELQYRTYPGNGGQYELTGWEMVEKWDLPGNAQRVAEEAIALLKAPDAPHGVYDIIVGPCQLAMNIHESVAHNCELDRMLGHEINYAGGSFIAPRSLGRFRYGSPIVNITADPTALGLGSFGFDDEGVQAQRTEIITEGILQGCLSSRDTAPLIGHKRSTGCMRAEGWHRAPIIRITNVSLEPGTEKLRLEELISDTKRGIFFDNNRSWSIDSSRLNFQFGAEEAWLIRNGKKVQRLRNASFSGITPQFWGSCNAICGSSEYKMIGVPNCGKGQPGQTMYTGHGSSPARFRKVKVGVSHAEDSGACRPNTSSKRRLLL